MPFALVLAFVSFNLFAKVEVYFSPDGRCQDRLVEMIDSAKKSVKVIVYSLNNKAISQALLRAHRRRGVKVQVLTDRVQASSRYSLAVPLYDRGLDLKVHSKFKIEHNKFTIVDAGLDTAIVQTGSFNYTEPAQTKNSENCVFLDQKRTWQKFNKRFEELWSLNSYERSDDFIKRLKERDQEQAP